MKKCKNCGLQNLSFNLLCSKCKSNLDENREETEDQIIKNNTHSSNSSNQISSDRIIPSDDLIKTFKNLQNKLLQ